MAVLDIERECLDDSTVLLSVKGYLDAFSVADAERRNRKILRRC